MAVSRARLVDRVLEGELLDDGGRPEVEHLPDFLRDKRIVKVRTAVRVHKYAHRLSHSYRVGQLHQALLSNSRRHKILGYVAGRISCAPVHFRGVLAGESAAAVGSSSAVGIHYYLAPGEPGIARRTSDDELASRVDVQDEVRVKKLGRPLGKRGYQSRNHYIAHVALNPGVHPLVAVELVVLGAHYYSMHP